NGWTPPWRRPGKTPAANGRVPEPTPEPIDVAALLAKAKAFQKLSDLTSDRDYLDQLARLEVVDKEKANDVDVAAREALGGKKYIAKLVKIAMEGPRKAARRLASHPPKPRTTLPEILVDRPIHEVIADAVDCLRADPEVFKRGPALVRMIRNENPPKGLQDTEGTPQIAVIPATRLIELLSRSALWVRERTNQEGDPILVATDPTATHASLVKDRCDWPGIRILDRVTEAPCLRPDGTILQVPGYDPETGLFYLPESGVEFPEIPENPTPADARDAAKLLLDLVVDFPFEPSKEEGRESPHKYAWLASLLTMLCRSAIKGPCPLFLFTANTAGSGKTKLNDVNAIIATGRRMPRSSYTENDEEIAKVLFSIALGGFPVVFFDNVGSGGALGGSAFDEALTSTSINGRILGASEMREVPFYAVLFATGNNVRLKGDIHRRIVPCRLESPDEHPEQRDNFKLKEDLEEYTRKHRPAFVAAGLTIVRAYIVAGRPQQHLTPMDYPAWSGLIRNAVSWATGIDPCATREAIDDSDGDANELKRLVVAWEDLCDREKKDAISAADALKAIRPDPATKCSRYDELFDLFTGMSKSGALPTSKVLGKILGKYRGRVVGTETGPKSLREITLHGNVSWFVRPAPGKPTPAKGGSGGSGGSNSGYPVTKTDFSLPRQVSETEEKKGEKKTDFFGHQRDFDPPDPPDPPGIDSDREDDTVLPCGGCWRMDCPWCTPADDNASEGGAR
ncbi:MAG: hypothetical protein JOZ63_00955, partial [Planctomycetaceae bacterium]|nr:hypothetical protein [Planctomycetaceae bacterium]